MSMTTASKPSEQLDAHVREIIAWHFNPETGTPFWLEKAKELGFDPRKEVKCFDDLKKFGHLRGRMAARRPRAPLGAQRLCRTSRSTSSRPAAPPASPRAASSSTISGSTTKCSARRCPTSISPRARTGSCSARPARAACVWPSSICASIRGGICFCVDLDPRWVVKLIKKGWMEHLKAYQEHVIDQALTILSANHDIKCMFTTPKLLDALAGRLEKDGTSVAKRPASPASSAAAPR